MTIIDTIKDTPTLQALADSGDYAGIVSAWVPAVLPAVRVGGLVTATGLIAAGHNWFAISADFDATSAGRDLKFLMQSSGIDWSHPLTVATLEHIKSAVITQGVIDTLIGLSSRFGEVPTADDVAAVMSEDSKRKIIATTLAIPQAIIDPQQRRLNAMAAWLQTTDDDMTPAELQAYADELLSTTDGNPVGHPSGYDDNRSGE